MDDIIAFVEKLKFTDSDRTSLLLMIEEYGTSEWADGYSDGLDDGYSDGYRLYDGADDEESE